MPISRDKPDRYASREEAIIARAWRLLGWDEPPADSDSVREALTGDLLDAAARDIASGAVDSPAMSILYKLKSVAPADDCAAWRAGAFDLLATTDMLVEGTHFLLPDRERFPQERLQALDALGWKSLAVNVSDIAACGGEPLGYLISLGLPSSATDQEIDVFTDGLARAATRYRIAIWGGDLVKSDAWTVCVTALGVVPTGMAVTRKARAYDTVVMVSGYIGLAAVGLEIAKNAVDPADYPEAFKRFATPDARLELGIALRKCGLAGAMIDTSDSLAKSIRLIAEQSGFGVVADMANVAVHPEVERYLKSLIESEASEAGNAQHVDARDDFLFNAAEDFELVFTARRDDLPAIRALADSVTPTLPISTIASIESGNRLLMARSGRLCAWSESGFEHFNSKANNTLLR